MIYFLKFSLSMAFLPAVPSLEIQALAFVVLGHFNPMIFHPSWFKLNELVEQEEVNVATEENAKRTVMMPEFAQIRFTRVLLEVTHTRFSALSRNPGHFELLRDFVLDIFRLLPHTPVTKLGINLEQHWKMENEEAWNSFGHELAPKDRWKKFMKDPGLTTMTMRDKGDQSGTFLLLNVANSEMVKPGLFFQTNRHYDLDMRGMDSAVEMIKLIQAEYANVLKQGEEAIKTLLQV